VIGMSSNKVYGDLAGVKTEEQATRYVVPDWPNGFDESLPLEFHGPYGCSKGVADQYLGDYARTYGMKTASLRQSSVYGPHQHPRSDQGWVAHLVGEAVRGRQIQLNGIGKQVRDLLHARDLARLFVLLAEQVEPSTVNQVNVGGGPENALSILELFEWLASNGGVEVDYLTGDERPSDQKVFVSDNRKVGGLTGWSPEISLDQGLVELLEAARGA
jgi:CDP-paratose 2-epimerase